MEVVKRKKSGRVALSIAISALLVLSVGLTLIFAKPMRASAEASVWNGELADAGWSDTSTALWGIDSEAASADKTAAPAGYTVNTAQKKITLASAEALAYFAHEVNIDLGHKLDGYTVTLTTDVDLNNKFWIPIGSFGNRAQDKEDSVDNVPRFSGTFKGEVQDGDSVRAAKITNFTFDIKEVFKDATMPQFADANRNGFKDVTLDVEGTTIKLETGDEGFAESSTVYYSQIEPFMVKFESEDAITAYNEEHGTEIPAVNTVGGLLINEDIKAYYDEMRASDPAHAAEYNMLQNRFYNRIGGEYRIIFKEYNKTFAEYFRANRQLLVFKPEYTDQIRDGSSADNGTRPIDPETGALDTSTTIYESFRTSVDAGQVFSYGFFASTKNATISGLRFELGNAWDFSNFGVTVLDKDGKDTGLTENLIVDQGAVLVGFGYGDLTMTDCQVGTPENGGLIYGTSYSNPAYGGLVGRMYGAHCGLPSSNPEDAALRPDEYYNKDSKVEFKDCKNYASFDTFDTGTLRCGGIAGYLRYHANYVFENCENYGQIQGVNAGGIAGELQNGLTKTDEDGAFNIIFKNCKNFGNVESVLQDELNGTNYDLIHPNLNVRSRNSGLAGGMIGNLLQIGYTEGSKLILENCANRGTIISDGVAGGLIAQLSDPYNSSIPTNFKNDVYFSDCYNYGNVTADVAFTKIPVKSELLNPTYTFTKDNTSAGAFIGRIGSGTLPDGMTLYTVTYGTDESGKYLTYGVPAAKNANAYAKDKDGNFVTYIDEEGNTVYQRYTRNFLNNTLLIHLTGANAGNIVSADTARGAGADCVTGGGARIFLKGSYFVDASDAASAVPNINLPEGFILWVTDAANNGSATRNTSSGSYTNNLLNYISAITNFANNKYHYISGREGAAEGSDFNENNFPTFEWVDDMDWATAGTATYGVRNVLRAPVQARAATADYTLTYANSNGNTSTWVNNKNEEESGTLANIAATKAQIKEWNDAGKTVDIVIASNVASVIANAFYDADNTLEINSVVFEIDTTTGISACQIINDSAFRNTKIGTISIPHVKTVSGNAFRDSTIDEITISWYAPTAAAASIGTSTFQDATIGTITIADSDKEGNLKTTATIGYSAFENATITGALNISGATNIYGLSGTNKPAFLNANLENVEKIVLHDITAIGANAFENLKMNEMDITLYALTATTSSIGASAFKGATIDNITITDSDKEGNLKTSTTIGANAFENAVITNTLTVTNIIGTMGNYAFQGIHAGELKLTFYVPAATGTKTIGMGTSTFKGANIGKLTIADSDKAGNTKTTTTISTSAFENATITTALNISNATIGATAFLNANVKNAEKIVLEDVATIGNNAFENLEMNELEITFYIPEGVASKTASIGSSTFKNATVSKLTIADSEKVGNTKQMLSIGASAFLNVKNIDKVVANAVSALGANAFENTEINEIAITVYASTATAVTINTGAFKDATIGKITIADSTADGNKKTTTTISYSAFENATITTALNISGATSINGLSGANKPAFLNANLENLEKVVLHDITSIGNYVFENLEINELEITCYALTVTTANIGTGAFKGTTIGKLTIADSVKAGNNKTVTSIGANAFENAEITTVLNISDATIGNNAFLNANLKNVNKIILNDIASIGNNAFENTEINEIEITLYVPATYTTKTANIGNYAFRNTTIITVTIADSTRSGNTKTTTSIGTSAFQNDAIGTIIIGDGVTTIGQNAFRDANITTLTYYTSVTATQTTSNNPFTGAIIGTVTFKKAAAPRPSDATEYAGEYAVPNHAFRAAKQITSVIVEEGVTVIGTNAFYGTNATTGLLTLGSVSLPDTLKTIGAYAFQNAKLSAITIPASVTEIGISAFDNYNIWTTVGLYTKNFAANQRDESVLTKITLASGSKLQTIGNYAFRDAHIIQMNLPNTLVSIGNNAFYRSPVSGTTKLANIFGADEQPITFDATGCTTLTTIGANAFVNAYLSDFTIPASVTEIGNNAFDNNNLWNTLYTQNFASGARNEDILTKITLASGSQLQTIGNFAFRDAHIIQMDLPNTLVSIGNSAFARSAVSGQKLANIFGADEHSITFNATGCTTLTTIGTSAFVNAYLSEFTIPASVTEIGTSAFNNNNLWNTIYTKNFATGEVNSQYLTTISLASGSRLKTIGGSAFRDTLFEKMVLPQSVTYIGDYAFARSVASGQKLANQSTHEVELYNDGADLVNLGNNAFYGAYIKKFHVSGNISDCSTALRFADLNNATVANIWEDGENITAVRGAITNKLADGVFTYATIDELTLGEGLVWIGSSVFSNAKIGGGRIRVPSTVKWLGASAFNSTKSTDDEKCVIEFADPASLDRIGASAFANVNVVKLVIAENIKDCTYGYISQYNNTTKKNENVYRFSNHTSILTDSIFSSATVYDLTLNNHEFGKSIFHSAHVKTLTVNGDVTSTTGTLYNTYTQIYELKIGEHVETLIDGLFKDARIYSVTINNGNIEGAPFEGAQIKELYLTENALVVGGTLLNNLLVGTVHLPEGITSISAGLFTYSNIGTLVIPASVEKIDDFAFRATKVSHFRLAENSNLKEIGNFAFGGAAIDSYILPEGLEKIGDGAFAQVRTDVTSITLPTTLQYVGVKAFGGNTRLNTVYIPEDLSADAVFDSPFDAGTSQNPLFIVAENAETYFRLKESNSYFVSESNFTYVVTVKFHDEMGNGYAELEDQQVLFGIGYSTSLVYGQWVNNSRFALPDEFYNYVWRCGDEIVSNVGNLDALIRNGNTDEVILVGLHRVGGKYAFVARTDIVYNGTEYSHDNINALLDNRFSLIDETMEVEVIKYNQQPVENANVTIKNAGTYTVSVTYDEEEDPVLFDIVIARITTKWTEVPYVISWDYSAFDTQVNSIQAVPNYIAADLPNAEITYTVSVQGESEPLTTFTTDANGAVVESAAVEVLNNLPVLSDNGNYVLNVSMPQTVNYTALNDSLLFRVGVLHNTWTTSLKVMSWVKGNFETEIENENGETVYPIQAVANKGDVYIEVLANDTDEEGNEIVLLDRTLCGSEDLTAFLSGMDVGTYIIRATVDGTTDYTGLEEMFIFRVFNVPGLPWWAVLLIVIGSLGIAALILWILHEKGILQMLTGRIVIAMRTRMTVDATIAAVRANKRAEESRKSIAKAEAIDRLEAARKAREEELNKSPEERAAALEEKAAAETAKAEKSQKRAERLQKQAKKLKGEDEVETPVTVQAEAVDAETDTAAAEDTNNTDEE